MKKTVRGVLATLAASAALAGCMAMGAQEKEGQLAAAGFVRQQADTPQKMAKLQALPQNTIVFSQRKKGNVYIYADAAGCNCAFIGNDAAYQQYQQNSHSQQHRADARDDRDAEPGRRDGLGWRMGPLRPGLVLTSAAPSDCGSHIGRRLSRFFLLVVSPRWRGGV